MPTPTPAGVNWAMIGGIVGAVIVVALAVLYFVRKKAS
jgi:LPXTG-motif cell wall-anchored protein